MKFKSLIKAIGYTSDQETSRPQLSYLRWLLVLSFVFGLFVSSASSLRMDAIAQQESEAAKVVRVAGANDTVAGPIDSNDTRYRIGPGDVLSILVRKAPELSGAVRVDQRGMIRIPMIDGDVRAACLTETELATQIATLYLEFKQKPNVEVFVSDFQSRPVAVIGAVNAPGQFRLQRRVRLAYLLTFAGGPATRAGRIINIVHTSEPNVCPTNASETKSTVTPQDLVVYKLDDTLKGKEEANPFVEAGDIISLPEADQVFIIGHVLQPQAISLRDKPITISRAIAMSGGTARDAATNRIHIIRQTADGQGKQEIFVDLKAVLKQKAEDIALLPYDIVEVPSSAGKTILTALTGAIVPTLSNVPVRLIP